MSDKRFHYLIEERDAAFREAFEKLHGKVLALILRAGPEKRLVDFRVNVRSTGRVMRHKPHPSAIP